MHTMQEDGFRKCRDGLTTIEEVMRVVFTAGH
jgi:type II secretory ATPase GspE/PulE/Tfp pilus assembly ATPase PilB-like protein